MRDRRLMKLLFFVLVLVPLTPIDGAEPIRAMTFNIRYNNPRDGENAWPHRKQFVADLIKQHKVDVVGMQEALKGQIEDLTPLLREYNWYGVGRDDGKSRGEFSPIFYRRDRLELVSKKTFWLSETPDKPGSRSWDAAITRVATRVRFKDKLTGEALTVVNTHFDHRGVKARENSAKLIVQRVADLDSRSRLILMGDFNCSPGSAPYNAIVDRKTKIRDSRDLTQASPSGPNSTWNGFRAVVPNRRIDFVFVRGPLVVRKHETIDQQREGRFPSDHLPVLATLE